MDGFSSVSFVVDMECCKDVSFLLAYLNRPDSYAKLQHIRLDFNDMINFKRIFGKKVIAINEIVIKTHKQCQGVND